MLLLFFLGMSHFKLSRFHPELLCFPSHVPVHHITPPHQFLWYFFLFCFVLLCSTEFFSYVFNCFAVISFPPPSFCCSVSSGLKVAPAHTSTRHEAVRVWLESLSGGSADLRGALGPVLDVYLYLSTVLSLQHAETRGGLQTHEHARLPAIRSASPPSLPTFIF